MKKKGQYIDYTVDDSYMPEDTGLFAPEEPEQDVEPDDKEPRSGADLVTEDISKAIAAETGRSEKADENQEQYRLGDYTFRTYYEYRNAQEDVKRIRILNEELDLHDPEVVLRLYNMIRNGEIVFRSPVGDEFFRHVADVVADRSKDLLEDKAVVDEADEKARGQKSLAIAVFILAAAAFLYFGISELQDVLAARKLRQMQQETTEENHQKPATSSTTATTGGSTEASEEEIAKRQVSEEILPEYASLAAQYPEMVGWLSISGTDIDYPVMQKQGDNAYYLNHSADGTEDKNGSVFMDYRCSADTPTENTILYGHNMTSGMMFGSLKEYLTESYAEAHKEITFNTLHEKRTYELVAVCLAEVEYQDSGDFKYYDFTQARTQGEFDTFLDFVQRTDVLSDPVELTSADQILTLSTCNNYTQDGRMCIVAKRVD